MAVSPNSPDNTASQANSAAVEPDFPLDFGKLVQALSTGYERIFYIDPESNCYREYSSPGKYADLRLIESGEDFFADAAQEIAQHVYEGDRVRLSKALRRKTLFSNLKKQAYFTIIYLYIENDMWREMYDFTPDAVLLVLASEYYDEADYIRNYDEFRKFIASKESEN